MQLTSTLLTLATLASTILASPTPIPTISPSSNTTLTTPKLEARGHKYAHAATLATFTDTKCYVSPTDWEGMGDGYCFSQPGWSVDVYWLESGCQIKFSEDKNCGGTGYWTNAVHQCHDASNWWSYQIYC